MAKVLRVNPNVIIITRALIHCVSLLYLVITIYLGLIGQLEGDPVQFLIDFTGIGALNLLLLSLSISPIASAFRFSQIMRIRKTLGVYSAIYALAHLGVFISFELQFEWALIIDEIIVRPYISVGFIALCILSALLITSFNTIKLAMGRTWTKLHRLVYVALVLILLHYLWSIKASEYLPYIYIVVAILLMFTRAKKLKIFK